MGGLDSRFAISSLDYVCKVSSLRPVFLTSTGDFRGCVSADHYDRRSSLAGKKNCPAICRTTSARLILSLEVMI
jgi:hypothetical protein